MHFVGRTRWCLREKWATSLRVQTGHANTDWQLSAFIWRRHVNRRKPTWGGLQDGNLLRPCSQLPGMTSKSCNDPTLTHTGIRHVYSRLPTWFRLVFMPSTNGYSQVCVGISQTDLHKPTWTHICTSRLLSYGYSKICIIVDIFSLYLTCLFMPPASPRIGRNHEK